VQAERQRQPTDAATCDENRHGTPLLLPGRHDMRGGRGQLRRAATSPHGPGGLRERRGRAEEPDDFDQPAVGTDLAKID
jgi:hypothetical protein